MSARDARPLRRGWRVALEPAVLIALAGCCLLMAQWADPRPFWLDEEMIALNVRDRSFADLAGLLWLDQSAPLGWLALERAALLGFGTGEQPLRLVPLLFGIATIAAALWVGLRWMGRLGAAALVLLCTFNAHLSHYPLEVKHYSADALFGLLLPALAVWVTDIEPDDTRFLRRALVWWAVASIGLWVSNGAIFIAPASALLILLTGWRRHTVRAAGQFALAGVMWMASIGLHYVLSLRYTHTSGFLRRHWANQLPPESAGAAETAAWILDRIQPLGRNPGGTDLWILLWLLAVCGFTFGSRPLLGAAFATAPMSAFILAALKVVPLHERFSLWMAPALYAGVALSVDRAMAAARRLFAAKRWGQLLASVAVVLGALYLCTNVVTNGVRDLRYARPRDHKHNLDDRTGVRWLMAQRQPGDAVLTTRLGWPAVWWYGGIDVAGVNASGGLLADGSRMYEVRHLTAPTECSHDQVGAALKDHRRALVYLGFRDVPDGFGDLLLFSLDRMGVVAAYKRFADYSFAAVVELHGSGSEQITFRSMLVLPDDSRTQLDGCLGIRPANRW